MLNPVTPSLLPLPVKHPDHQGLSKNAKAFNRKPVTASPMGRVQFGETGADESQTGGSLVTRRRVLVTLASLVGVAATYGAIARVADWWPFNGFLGGSGVPTPPPSSVTPKPDVSSFSLPPSSLPSTRPETVGNMAEADYKLEVNYNNNEQAPKTYSVSGLLNGFNPGGVQSVPTPTDIAQLKPQLWRLGEDQLLDKNLLNSRVKPSGASLEFVLSDSFPYPFQDQNWQPPQGAAFQQKVKSLYKTYGKLCPYWDIWNEPDVGMYWKIDKGNPAKSYRDFLNTFIQAARAIREVDGGQARIVGPSLGEYNEGKLRQFLDACVANGVRLDVLSWHDLWAPDDHNDFSIVSQHIRDMRKILDEPRYRNLGCSEIHVSELVGKASTEKPGNMIASYYYAELGGQSAPENGKVLPVRGARATWSSQINKDEPRSYNNTLGGLLKPNTGLDSVRFELPSGEKVDVPGYYKAPYYAQWAYAEVTPSPEVNRPLSTIAEPLSGKARNANIVALASPVDSKVKEILVAYGDVSQQENQNARTDGGPIYEIDNSKMQNIQLVITDPDIRADQKKQVQETHILNTPDSEDGSTKPYSPFQHSLRTAQVNGQMAVLLENVQPGELRKVVVQNA